MTIEFLKHQQMSNTPKINAAALKAYFEAFTWNRIGRPPKAGFFCNKMARAWRNRSPVTSAPWWNFAHQVSGDSSNAGACYAACSHFAVDGIFTANDLTPEQLEKLARIISSDLSNSPASLPEKALSRGQYEDRKRHTPDKEEICHLLYNALLAWRTNGGQRADIWRITKEAEAAYRRVFRPNEQLPKETEAVLHRPAPEAAVIAQELAGKLAVKVT